MLFMHNLPKHFQLAVMLKQAKICNLPKHFQLAVMLKQTKICSVNDVLLIMCNMGLRLKPLYFS